MYNQGRISNSSAYSRRGDFIGNHNRYKAACVKSMNLVFMEIIDPRFCFNYSALNKVKIDLGKRKRRIGVKS